MRGEIPAELGNLASLTWLFFGGNQLSGEIPAELGNLTFLTALHLYGNRLSGCVASGLQGQFRLRPVVSSLLRHPRRLAPGIVRSPTLRQVQPLVHQRPAQRADPGQEHPGLAVGHLAQPPTVLPGHSRRFPPLLGEVAAVQHPHGLGVPQPGTQVLLKESHHRVVIPGGGGEEALHGPGRDPRRLGEILGVAPVLGLYQEGPEIVPAVVPRLTAPEQRSEVSVKILKGLVHLLESRSIHFPASPAQALSNQAIILSCQPSL